MGWGGVGRGGGVGGVGWGGGWGVASLVALSFEHGNSAHGALVFKILYIAVCFCFQSFKIKSC